jgi:IclR family KDG regulon transcriptional repressor
MPTQSVDRAIAVLRAFSVREPVLGVTELGRKVGLHKSTVHRLLASLERGGLVERDPGSRKYRLGIGLVELGYTVLSHRRLPHVVLPYLRYLADTVEEMSYLAVQIGEGTLTILQVPSPHMLQSVSRFVRGPLHCTCTGKVFLAQMTDTELGRVLDGELPRFTDHTITDRASLREAVQKVREQGYATVFEEHTEGENAVAVAIRRHPEQLRAAVGLVGPAFRFTREKVLGTVDVLKSVAGQVSRNLESPPYEDLD